MHASLAITLRTGIHSSYYILDFNVQLSYAIS